MKDRLQKTFEDKLIFHAQEYHSPVFVISKDFIQTQTLLNTLQFSNKSIVKKYISVCFERRSIKAVIDDVADNPWPPTVESLNKKASKIPELL